MTRKRAATSCEPLTRPCSDDSRSVRPNFNLVTASKLDLKSYYKEIHYDSMWLFMYTTKTLLHNAILENGPVHNLCLCICALKGIKTPNKGALTRETVKHIVVNHFLSVKLEACSSSCGFVGGRVHVRQGDSTRESSHSGKQNAKQQSNGFIFTACDFSAEFTVTSVICSLTDLYYYVNTEIP